jgi:hypothetical protein
LFVIYEFVCFSLDHASFFLNSKKDRPDKIGTGDESRWRIAKRGRGGIDSKRSGSRNEKI